MGLNNEEIRKCPDELNHRRSGYLHLTTQLGHRDRLPLQLRKLLKKGTKLFVRNFGSYQKLEITQQKRLQVCGP